ncbi:hypothetical protein QTG54_006967, partial [Skeletonema marinoi]
VTPSPTSRTTPVVRPEAYKLNTAGGATNNAGHEMSQRIFRKLSLCDEGLCGDSVSNTGCSSILAFKFDLE